MAVSEGRDGVAHVLTSEGLWRIAAAVTRVAGRPPERVRGLAQTHDGDWWVGTTAGVFLWRAGEWALSGEQPGPGSAEVFHVTAVGDGLWAATEGGLWARRGGAWELHGPAEQADGQSRAVRALAAGSGATLWLARADGVLRYDPGGRRIVSLYTPANSGLASSRVNSLLEHAGLLWVFTDAGVSRLELGEG